MKAWPLSNPSLTAYTLRNKNRKTFFFFSTVKKTIENVLKSLSPSVFLFNFFSKRTFLFVLKTNFIRSKKHLPDFRYKNVF